MFFRRSREEILCLYQNVHTNKCDSNTSVLPSHHAHQFFPPSSLAAIVIYTYGCLATRRFTDMLVYPFQTPNMAPTVAATVRVQPTLR